MKRSQPSAVPSISSAPFPAVTLLTTIKKAATLCALLLLSACGGGSTSSVVPPPTHDNPPPTSGVRGVNGVNHIVIAIQENRSFDNLFHGFPGADTVSTGLIHTGQRVTLQQIPLTVSYDLRHHMSDFVNAYDGGKMDGFDLEKRLGGPDLPEYGYVRQSDVQEYWDLAKRYTLGDRMFPSQIDASFSAHQYLIAGQTAGAVDVPSAVPWGCDAPGGTTVPTLITGRSIGPGVFPCFDYQTLGDELDRAGGTWRYYAPPLNAGNGDYGGQIWVAYDAVRHIRYGADWQSDNSSPETAFLTDVQNGHLANVTWVAPDFLNSDHPGVPSDTGPAWIASLANTLGASKFWNDTVLLVVWDDWGGWYDHVPPPQLDLHGLGIRVPLIVVSPFAKRGYVSHDQYEWGSVLGFVEQTFGLHALAASDSRANPLTDCFNFAQKARPYQAIRSRKTPADFIHEIPSGKPPDDD